MHRHERAAMPARPADALAFDERLRPVLLHFLEVLDHAHAVFQAIALVELPKAGARELGTIDTGCVRILGEVLAELDAARDTVVRLGRVVLVVAAWARSAITEVTDTDPTVHAAGSEQFDGERVWKGWWPGSHVNPRDCRSLRPAGVHGGEKLGGLDTGSTDRAKPLPLRVTIAARLRFRLGGFACADSTCAAVGAA